jgi:hypothetical protein
MSPHHPNPERNSRHSGLSTALLLRLMGDPPKPEQLFPPFTTLYQCAVPRRTSSVGEIPTRQVGRSSR